MNDMYQIERLGKLHLLIKKKEIGSPQQFAEKLNVGIRYFHRLKEQLKELGAEIAYSKSLKSYFYTNQFDLNIRVDIHVVADGQKRMIYYQEQLVLDQCE